MATTQTEMTHGSAMGLDEKPPHDALRILARAQAEAAQAVEIAVPEIAAAAQLAADSIAGGGRLIYVAAGSSGLMALADALELPGTYGIGKECIVVLFAGGLAALTAMEGAPEDDEDEARKAIAGAGVARGDCVIALSASGHTPFALAAVQAAHLAGAKTIGLANNRGAALLGMVDVAICLPTPPEVVAGSTRMGAGTAQKIALNMLSTMMAIHLGHVHDGYMVNVLADNIKLRGRALRIVMAVGGVGDEAAARALEVAGGRVKVAILLAAGAEDVAGAERLLAGSGGKVRGALAALGRR
ncbi:N-acetylmuramic acid 6-phosphate etherase [uncultured Devosia sp.]|uniref:N-acetylmuramic acid 6-phosphate etherase n=1 Tax=uncultured Devosia sp. TaxID=211434 RepID=UPI0035CAA117